MAILAGVIAVLHFITILTLINVTALNLGSALFSRLLGQKTNKWHSVGIFISILSPVLAEDLRQHYHRSSVVS
jgi:hypothetical protein